MLPPSRRTFLGHLAAGLGGAWATISHADLLAAHQHAHVAAATTPPAFRTFSPADAIEVEAMTAEIIPTDATPGAVDAHVVHFIDQILTRPDEADELAQYKTGLPILAAKTRELYPSAARFSALAPADRQRVLEAIEDTPFFQMVRGHTVAGFLTDPKYGGNAGGIGWTHIGFTPDFAYQPPFGDYDAEVTRASAPEPK